VVTTIVTAGLRPLLGEKGNLSAKLGQPLAIWGNLQP